MFLYAMKIKEIMTASTSNVETMVLVTGKPPVCTIISGLSEATIL